MLTEYKKKCIYETLSIVVLSLLQIISLPTMKIKSAVCYSEMAKKAFQEVGMKQLKMIIWC